MKDLFRSLALVTELGLVLVICIGGGLLLGVYIDRKLSAGGVFTVICLLAGIGSGFWMVYRMVMPGGKE